jgi:hypothetical protein
MRHTIGKPSKELQLCLKPHHHPRSTHKVMGLQSRRSPIWHDFGTHSGILREKNHLDVSFVASHIVYYKGEGGGFPQVRVVMSLMCPCCPWLVLAPRVLQLCTNNFVWVVCRPVWVSEACQLFIVPSRSSNTPFYPSKVLWTRERAPTPFSSVVFYLDSHLSPSRSWEHVIEGHFL